MIFDLEETEETEALKNKLEMLKKKISECRKKGRYTKIAEMKIKNIPSKIMMANVTLKKIDIDKAMLEIETVEKEIRECEKESINDKEAGS